MNILEILKNIEDTTSRKEKERILEENKESLTLQTVLRKALDPRVLFGLRNAPERLVEGFRGQKSLSQALQELEKLETRQFTGNAAIQFVQELIDSLTEDDSEVIKRVIGKDLRCGINIATVNKIFPNLIPIFDVMLIGSSMKKIQYPAISQCKADGVRARATIGKDNVLLFSRNNILINVHDVLTDYVRRILKENEILDGELRCIDYDTQQLLPRKTSSGIINKALKGTISEEEANTIVFIVWDLIKEDKTIQYVHRFNELSTRIYETRISPTKDKIRLIESIIVNNEQEALVFFNKMREQGEEGIIIKNMNNLWKGKRVDDMCKWKDEIDADLICVGWNEGTGKNKGRLGALVFETNDGLLKVKVGEGFSDKQRQELTKENTNGLIGVITYNEVINSKNKREHSLFLPRFKEWRLDKSDADSLNTLLNKKGIKDT